MTGLQTSAPSIYRWLGAGPLRNSDNLKLPGPAKGRLARIYWNVFELDEIETWKGGDGVA